MIHKLFEKYKATRRILIFWCMTVISLVAVCATNPITMPLITDPVARVHLGLIGLCATITAFYLQHRAGDKRREDEADSD